MCLLTFQKLFDKSRSTLNLLRSFENDVSQTCIHAANIINHFGALSDTQFMESKVEESPEMEMAPSPIDDTVRAVFSNFVGTRIFELTRSCFVIRKPKNLRTKILPLS